MKTFIYYNDGFVKIYTCFYPINFNIQLQMRNVLKWVEPIRRTWRRRRRYFTSKIPFHKKKNTINCSTNQQTHSLFHQFNSLQDMHKPHDADWKAAAITQDSLVVDLLLRLKHSATRPSPGKLVADLAPAGWGAKQPRSGSTISGSKSVSDCRRKSSPSTPLSWSGGSGGGVDGCDTSSLPIHRSKVIFPSLHFPNSSDIPSPRVSFLLFPCFIPSRAAIRACRNYQNVHEVTPFGWMTPVTWRRQSKMKKKKKNNLKHVSSCSCHLLFWSPFFHS